MPPHDTARRDPQLLKGVLPLLLLRLLAAQESYGYELVVRLREHGLEGVATGTVYPALTRLERDGQVSSRLLASASGPARKYYRLTERGYTALRQAEGAWHSLSAVVSALVSTPVPTAPRTAEEKTP
ncbi:PadR family transcriptional regulator [Allosalinactinospora lopnorensis]|uniref:PadR family transcriptional regulator n=1 Tax=Allosalinactinospora lopnorensis TaxID=1352348 RepID=UPI000623C0BF|nr:PadR family transcriptional regulator [Allosalinactinospora lopnorensis]